MLKIIFAIATGGALGSVLRWVLSNYINEKSTLGILTVNLLGCFSIGVSYALFSKYAPMRTWYFFVITGLLGGFTTYSSFSLEMVLLWEKQAFLTFFSRLAVSILGGFFATWVGIWGVKQFF